MNAATVSIDATSTVCVDTMDWSLRGARIDVYIEALLEKQYATIAIDAFEAKGGSREWKPADVRSLQASWPRASVTDTHLLMEQIAIDELPATLAKVRCAAHRTRPRCYACRWDKSCATHADDATFASFAAESHNDSETDEPMSATRVAGETFFIGDHVEVSKAYVRNVGDHPVFDDGSLFTYTAATGLFAPLTDARESVLVQEYSGSPIEKATDDGGGGKTKFLKLSASDVAGIIKLAHARQTRRGFFSSAPAGLAFADRFVEVTSKGIVTREHSVHNCARYGYPFSFAIDVAPRRFLKFLADIFAGASDVAERIALVQEFAGASLLGVATKYQLCLVLLGAGANGKSTLILIIKSAFPPAVVVTVPPQKWEGEYCSAALAGALLNAVNELPQNDILASERFKSVVSGDEVEAREPYKPVFHFKPRAGHLFGANKLPSSNDTTHGFWRRFAVLKFDRTFEGSQADPDLADRIIESERGAIVAWMVEGARRLMERGYYKIPSSSAEVLTSWKRNSNVVAIFVSERLVRLGDGERISSAGTPATRLYSTFRFWSEENGHRLITSTKFGMRLRELGYEPVHTKSGAVYPLRFGDGVTGCDGKNVNPSPEQSEGDSNVYSSK